jgi:hypothetical protein
MCQSHGKLEALSGGNGKCLNDAAVRLLNTCAARNRLVDAVGILLAKLAQFGKR